MWTNSTGPWQLEKPSQLGFRCTQCRSSKVRLRLPLGAIGLRQAVTSKSVTRAKKQLANILKYPNSQLTKLHSSWVKSAFISAIHFTELDRTKRHTCAR